MSKNNLFPCFFFTLFLTAGNLQAQVTLFPGDANNDGVANHYDLLPIGVAFGTEGFPRPGATNLWQPQFQPQPWLQNLPVSGINLAFTDCDGNGFIDSLDTDAIAFNFDSMQNASQPGPHPYFLGDTCFTCPKPTLRITFSEDSVMVADTFFAFLTLTYPQAVPPPLGALGIAFDLEYNPDFVQDELTRVFPDTVPGDLMFVAATSTQASTARFVPPGMVGFGAAGMGANAFADTRPLGAIRIVVEEAIIRADTVFVNFWIDASNLLIINELEQIVCPGGAVSDTIVLFDPADAVHEKASWEAAISVSPNPARGALFVESPEAEVLGWRLFDPAGRCCGQVESQPCHFFKIDLTLLSQGIYALKIKTKRGWTSRKIAVF